MKKILLLKQYQRLFIGSDGEPFAMQMVGTVDIGNVMFESVINALKDDELGYQLQCNGLRNMML